MTKEENLLVCSDINPETGTSNITNITDGSTQRNKEDYVNQIDELTINTLSAPFASVGSLVVSGVDTTNTSIINISPDTLLNIDSVTITGIELGLGIKLLKQLLKKEYPEEFI